MKKLMAITKTEIQIYETSSFKMSLRNDWYKIYPPERKIIIHSNNPANGSIFPLP